MSTMEEDGIKVIAKSRLIRLVKESGIRVKGFSTREIVESFIRSLSILSEPETRWNFSLPEIHDRIWHLSLLDNEYYPYICSLAGGNEVIPHDPFGLGTGSISVRRENFLSEYTKVFSQDSLFTGVEDIIVVQYRDIIGGNSGSFSVNRKKTINACSAIIEKELKAQRYRLIFDKKQLYFDQTWDSYSIGNGSLIHVVYLLC